MYERTGRVNERRRGLSQGSSSGMGGTEQRHREQGQRLSEGGRRERRRRRSLREAASSPNNSQASNSDTPLPSIHLASATPTSSLSFVLSTLNVLILPSSVPGALDGQF